MGATTQPPIGTPDPASAYVSCRVPGARARRALSVGVPALVILAIGLWGLDRGGMWRDEAVTFQVGRRTVPQIWRLLHDVDAVHGLYYLVMHAVLAVHPGEVVLRLPSVCAAAVTAALVSALGTRLVRPRVGLWAGLLYAVAPMAGHYAQEGRSYALVAAGATGATLLFVRAARAGSWCAYGTVLGVTCWLHEFAVLLLLAHAVSLALARAGRDVWRGWGRAAVAVALSLLPMVLVSRGQAAQVAWLRRPTADTAEGLLRLFLGPADGVYRVCLGLALLGLAGLVRRRGEITCAGVALPLAVVPPGVLMLLSQISPLYVDRYVLYALGGAPLLVACGAERVAGAAGRLWAERRPTPPFVPGDRPGLVSLPGSVPSTGSAARFDLVPPPDPAPHSDLVPVPAASRGGPRWGPSPGWWRSPSCCSSSSLFSRPTAVPAGVRTTSRPSPGRPPGRWGPGIRCCSCRCRRATWPSPTRGRSAACGTWPWWRAPPRPGPCTAVRPDPMSCAAGCPGWTGSGSSPTRRCSPAAGPRATPPNASNSPFCGRSSCPARRPSGTG